MRGVEGSLGPWGGDAAGPGGDEGEPRDAAGLGRYGDGWEGSPSLDRAVWVDLGVH